MAQVRGQATHSLGIVPCVVAAGALSLAAAAGARGAHGTLARRAAGARAAAAGVAHRGARVPATWPLFHTRLGTSENMIPWTTLF